jgi:riboflavin kinase/FMN adenylyltransferase
MFVLRDAESSALSGRSTVVGIGVFDGLHLGHQKVVGQVRRLAGERGAVATIVTFDPHPAWVLAPERAPMLLGTLDQRLASESATDFVQRVLVEELRAKDVVVGRDFRFGHERTGDVSLLEEEGRRHGFDVVAEPIHGGSSRWSSTVVRRALLDADLEQANATLGRPFALRGTVVHGDARGVDLGYPTANLELAAHQLVPRTGIYAGAVRLPDRTWWPAAISIGTRPQFYDDGALLVEVHVPGFTGDLYAAVLDVAFVARLRGEMTFAGVPQLVTQIDLDVGQTIEIFKKFSARASALLE